MLDALANVRDSGVAVGLSVTNPQVPALGQAIHVQRALAPLFAEVQATFNLFDQSAGPSLKVAHAAGMVVVVEEALANGRILRSELVIAEAAKLSTSADALALAWVMSHEWVDLCLSGAATVEQMRTNADALKLVPLDGELMERLGSLAVAPEAYWTERKALEWN